MVNKQIRLSEFNLPSLYKLDLPQKVKELINKLALSQSETYLIGGFVRDMVLGRNSTDLDFIIIDKSAVELATELALEFDGNFFVLDELTETTRLVLKNESSKQYTFDFTPVKKQELEKDFARRDFTINALAINIKEPDILIDKFSGLEDLKQKVIKAVKLQNLLDDPLRFLRAFRFACLINGEIDNETLSYIIENINSFDDSVSRERISVELWKILDCNNSFSYLRKLADSSLLEKIFPELIPMRKVTPNDFHHLWLFDHSVELIKTFEENFHKIPDWANEELNSPFGLLESPKKKAVVKLGCLFHDVGKPATWEIKKIDNTEKHTFYGHDKLGADIFKETGERLKFSTSIIQTISNLILYHLRPFQLSQGDASISDRALYRFFRDVGEDMPLLLMLAVADLYATIGPKVTKSDLEKGEQLLLFLYEKYRKHKERENEKAKKTKLMDGNEIMELTGLKPGRYLGDIIKELDEAIAVGEIKTKNEAQSWVLRAIQKINKPS